MPLTRRNFLATTAVTPAVAAVQGAPASSTAKSSAKPPHILFILVDQLTPFMTSPYGQKAAITPNLDRLAREGVVFENAYCNAPLCVPSRMSMFSGRLPVAIDAWDNAWEL